MSPYSLSFSYNFHASAGCFFNLCALLHKLWYGRPRGLPLTDNLNTQQYGKESMINAYHVQLRMRAGSKQRAVGRDP